MKRVPKINEELYRIESENFDNFIIHKEKVRKIELICNDYYKVNDINLDYWFETLEDGLQRLTTNLMENTQTKLKNLNEAYKKKIEEEDNNE